MEVGGDSRFCGWGLDVDFYFCSARPTPVFRDEKILGNEAATHCAEVCFEFYVSCVCTADIVFATTANGLDVRERRQGFQDFAGEDG